MNLPNKITLFRIIMIPVFMLLFCLNISPVWAGVIFIIASFSDFLDGYLARKYHLVTNFGKIMDPLADKLLVTAALLIFIEKGITSSWVVMIILAREFLITGFRVVAAADGKVIAAGWSGKAKTVTQLIAVIFGIFFGVQYPSAAHILLYIATALTLYSGAEYILKNIDILRDEAEK